MSPPLHLNADAAAAVNILDLTDAETAALNTDDLLVTTLTAICEDPAIQAIVTTHLDALRDTLRDTLDARRRTTQDFLDAHPGAPALTGNVIIRGAGDSQGEGAESRVVPLAALVTADALASRAVDVRTTFTDCFPEVSIDQFIQDAAQGTFDPASVATSKGDYIWDANVDSLDFRTPGSDTLFLDGIAQWEGWSSVALDGEAMASIIQFLGYLQAGERTRDRDALDQIAALLTPEGAAATEDLLEHLRDIVGATSRPHPSAHEDYARVFLERTGRAIVVDEDED